jgi:hypothetical protein
LTDFINKKLKKEKDLRAVHCDQRYRCFALLAVKSNNDIPYSGTFVLHMLILSFLKLNIIIIFLQNHNVILNIILL